MFQNKAIRLWDNPDIKLSVSLVFVVVIIIVIKIISIAITVMADTILLLSRTPNVAIAVTCISLSSSLP